MARVRTKIIGVIVMIGVMVLGGVYYAAGRMRQIDDDYTKFLERDALAWVNSARVAKNINETRYFMLRMSDNALAMENKKSIQQRINDGLSEAVKLADGVKEQSPAFAAQADGIVTRLAPLRQLGQKVTDLSMANKETEAKDLLANSRPQFDQLAADTDKLREDMEKAIKAGSDGLTDITNASIRLNWIVMSAILIAGMVLGIGVSQFGITNPLSSLVEVLQKLAHGEDVEITGTERKDEIGDTARAVGGIRVMLAEKAQREAEEKAELDRQTLAGKSERDRVAAAEKIEADKKGAAARDAATAKVMNEFDAAVGGIVKAAMDGDFSQRVALEGKEGVIRNLADAMNTMCDNIGKVMDDLVGMMGALAEGDLTQRITANYLGTFRTLKDSANTTAERLSATISDIKAAAMEVSNASAEISTSTTDLSQRTEEQAAGLEETSASMEQISVTVKKNAENAQHANQLTNSTRGVADHGGAVVAEAVGAMARIEESSRKIADIIGVIDEIARQTNLLALNAAVEAARAGDAGRGFAVVASEVRSLAQRSSQAAKDIKDLITSSSSQVKEGVDLVNKAGTSLNEIVESIRKVSDIVADIATASAEQATGLDQVNKALTQMDEVTQQNSALVEENAATAKTLELQSSAMDQRVSIFRIDSKQIGSAQAQGAPKVATLQRPASRPQTAPARRGGTVGRMQAGLATALKADNEFEEF
jgi:methyl-accepting chemotaxis protein